MLTPVRTLRSAASLAVLSSLLACSAMDKDSSKDDGTSSEGVQQSADLQDAAVDRATEELQDPLAQLAVNAKDAPPSQEQEVELRKQRREALVRHALDNAKALLERGDTQGARNELERALETDPGNLEVSVEYMKLLSISGERAGDTATVGKIAADRQSAMREAMRLEAEENFRQGKKARERGDFDDAIRSFERVRDSIQWSTQGVVWGDLPTRNQEALSASRLEAQNAVAADHQAKIQQAFEQIKSEEVAEQNRRRQQVANLLESAAMKFDRGDFDQSIELADRALEADPGNAIAVSMRENSIEARRKGRSGKYRVERERAYRQFLLEIEELRIPYSDGLTPASREYWQIVESRSTLGEANIDISAEDAAIRTKLKHTIILDFPASEDGEELTTIIDQLVAFTGIPMIVSPEAIEEASSNLVTLPRLTNLSAESLLKQITSSLSENLAWTVADGLVKLTTHEKAYGKTIIRVHGVQDLTFVLTNFKGPEIDKIALPGEYGDDPETSVFAADIEGESVLTLDNIITLIKGNVAPESWSLDDQFSIAEASGNQLLVIHTPQVQAEIAQFLDDLRTFSSTFVTVESRFVEITDAFIQEIGADFRGLGGAAFGADAVLDDTSSSISGAPAASQGFDNLGSGVSSTSDPAAGIFFNDNSDGDLRGRTENFFASPLGDVLSTVGGGAFQFAILDDTQINLVLNMVEKSVNATEIMSPTLTVYNTERANISVINEVSFLQDFDVDVANTAFIANPDVGVLQEGVVLDVRPTISYDRKYITLDVSTTIADLQRPIPTFETTLAGFTDAITFELPRMRIQSAKATVRVPDGGSVVMGGLKTIRHINRKATTPWLGNIPVVGFFFREKGVVDEVTSLMIVVRAHVRDFTAYREHTPVR